MLAVDFPSRRPRLAFVAVLLAAILACVLGNPATAAQTDSPTSADAGRVTISVEPGANTNATLIVEAHGHAITTAWSQFAALFGAEPSTRQYVAFVNDIDPAAIVGMRWITDFAWVSPDGTVAVIATGPFLSLTEIEAANILRNITSRGFIQAAAGGQMPLGLLDGAARYVETPVAARQARLASLVQGLDQAGTLPPWDQIAAGAVPEQPAEVQTASAYALVAFLTDRYGVSGLRDLVTGFATSPDLATNLAATYGQSEADLAPAWSQFLPRWFASGWRENAVSAFDISRAETLFERGAYEAAMSEAERSQRLFSELDDQASLAKVETLLAQCAIGLQADAIMVNAQALLETSKYTESLALIDEANSLYALLPPEHRPTTLIEQYQALATQGQAADTQLREARTNQGSWLSITSARSNAVSAGSTYASLGNEEGVLASQEVTDSIDERIQRLLFVLSALVIILAAWLGTWLWLRSPGRLQWRTPGQPARTTRTSQGGD